MDVVEEEQYWVILLNPDVQYVESTSFLGGVLELGVKDTKMFPRRLWLPKSAYPNRESAERVVKLFESCPICKEGKELNKTFLNKRFSTLARGNMLASEVGALTVGQFIAEGYKVLDEKYISPKVGDLGSKAIKVVIGAVATLSTFGFTMGKKTELAILGFGTNLVASGVTEILKGLAPASRPAMRLVPVATTSTPSSATFSAPTRESVILGRD